VHPLFVGETPGVLLRQELRLLQLIAEAGHGLADCRPRAPISKPDRGAG
jgi:hypothetical protein